MGKLAVLGLDGLSWPFLNGMVETGKMPRLRAVSANALRATLRALPPVTFPSWTSIMTGVNPGKHGIFGFFRYSKGAYGQLLYTSLDLRHPRIHEMAALMGVKGVVFNPMPDYPIRPVKNVDVVSNLFFAPKPMSYPPEAHVKYFGTSNLPQAKAAGCNVVEYFRDVIELYLAAVEKASSNADLLWVNLNFPDAALHRCPRMLGQPDTPFLSTLDKIVEIMDGRFDSFMLLSDHGFSEYRYAISINDILVKSGIARPGKRKHFRELGEIGGSAGIGISPRLYKLLRATGVARLFRPAVKAYSHLTGRSIRVFTKAWVDVEASEAFMPDKFSFGLYVKGGSEVIQHVCRVLSAYEDTIFVRPAEEVYWGKYVHLGPDIVVFPRFNRGFTLLSAEVRGTPMLQGRHYDHHPDGVLLVRTDKLKGITDMLPNFAATSIAMYLLGIPLPKSRDTPRDVERSMFWDFKEVIYPTFPLWR